MNQYERVRFTDGAYRFKAGLYIAGANHGQFNTTWGRTDVPEPFARFLNVAPLLPAAEQERIAKVYLSAFLDAALRGVTGYLPLFRDHRTAPAWLPETVYLHQFEDSRMVFVATFDEDLDLTSTTLDGGMLDADRLTVWREQRVKMKWATKESRAAYLGWMADATAAGEPARYTIALPPGNSPFDPSQALVFSLADAGESPEPKHEKATADSTRAEESEDDEPEDDDDEDQNIDLTVELADRAGRTVRLSLNQYAFLQPQVEAQVVKSRLFVDVEPAEPVFQLFALPLADFGARDPAFDVAALAEVRFVFDRTPAGVVILDDVGFATPPGGRQAGQRSSGTPPVGAAPAAGGGPPRSAGLSIPGGLLAIPLLAQAERAHVSPYLLDVREALVLLPLLAGVLPARRTRMMNPCVAYIHLDRERIRSMPVRDSSTRP